MCNKCFYGRNQFRENIKLVSLSLKISDFPYDKPTSLLHYGINYGHKKFYNSCTGFYKWLLKTKISLVAPITGVYYFFLRHWRVRKARAFVPCKFLRLVYWFRFPRKARACPNVEQLSELFSTILNKPGKLVRCKHSSLFSGAMRLCITTSSITTLSKGGILATITIKYNQTKRHSARKHWHYAEYCILIIVMLNDIVPCVVAPYTQLKGLICNTQHKWQSALHNNTLALG